MNSMTIFCEEVIRPSLPAITTMGYAGVLLGPALIGFVAHAANLVVALMLLAVMLLWVALSARMLKMLR